MPASASCGSSCSCAPALAWCWSKLVILKGLLLSLSQVPFTQGTLQAYWTFFVTLYTALLFVVP